MKTPRAVALALLLLLPTAAAGSNPAVYYLRDGEMGPLAEGELNATVPNATQPQVRPVPVGISSLVPVRFATDDEEHPARIWGPVYAALWIGPSPILHGNMTVKLVAVNGSAVRELANTTFALDANASNAPQPTAIMPPTPAVPPGPEYAAELAYYVLGQVVPVVTPPPRILYLGAVDAIVNDTESLALDFSITQGSSPLPVPIGTFGSIQYNGQLAPSLVYVPWYSPDPQVVPTWSYKPPATMSRPPTSNVAPSPSDSEVLDAQGGNGAPGLEFVVLALAVAAVALLRRRR